jgi:hypothetical protein
MLVMTSFGCGSSTTTPASPAPKAANDTSYKGVYKGVLSGSTGHFYIDAYNTDATKVTLSFTFDGVSLTLDGTQTTDGGNYLYTFSGSGYEMIFEVTSTGEVVSATFTYTGHTGTITVDADKATSATDVSVWEGTETGSCGTGVWNIIVKGSAIAGMHVQTTSSCGGEGQSDAVTGTLTGTSIVCHGGTGGKVTATGTMSGSSVSGTWSGGGDAGDSGTWSGTKTL